MNVSTMELPAGPLLIRVGGCPEEKLHHPLPYCGWCQGVFSTQQDLDNHECPRGH